MTFLGLHPSNHGFLSPQVGFLIHVMSSQIGLLALPGGSVSPGWKPTCLHFAIDQGTCRPDCIWWGFRNENNDTVIEEVGNHRMAKCREEGRGAGEGRGRKVGEGRGRGSLCHLGFTSCYSNWPKTVCLPACAPWYEKLQGVSPLPSI